MRADSEGRNGQDVCGDSAAPGERQRRLLLAAGCGLGRTGPPACRLALGPIGASRESPAVPNWGRFEEEDWYGSYYELAIEYRPKGEDARILDALRAMWKAPDVEGAWAWKDYVQRHDLSELVEFEGFQHGYGLLHLPGRRPIGCGSVVSREDDELGADWLVFYVPTGMLELVVSVEYPLWPRARNPWMDELDGVLLQMAQRIYAAAPFQLALIGEEVTGFSRGDHLRPEDVGGGYLVGPELLDRLRLHTARTVTLACGLRWFPWQ